MGVGAGKFLGVRRIFARISPNLRQKFWATFSGKIFSHSNCFWDDLQIGLHVILNTLGTIFSNQSTWAPFLPVVSESLPRFSVTLRRFSQILLRFPWILPGFSGILRGFSSNQNFWGALVPPAPVLLHH